MDADQDFSDDQQDITRGRDMVDSLFQVRTPLWTSPILHPQPALPPVPTYPPARPQWCPDVMTSRLPYHLSPTPGLWLRYGQHPQRYPEQL